MHYVIYLYITWLDFALERPKASLSYNISEAIQVPSVHSYMQRNTYTDGYKLCVPGSLSWQRQW